MCQVCRVLPVGDGNESAVFVSKKPQSKSIASTVKDSEREQLSYILAAIQYAAGEL